jgi:pimeloyl-ACP methyl ester carboxylesterase
LRKATIISAATVAGLLLLDAGCVTLQRKLLYFPTHHDETNGLAPWLKDGRLIGYAREVPHPKNVWLMMHGNGGQAADRAYAIHDFADDDSLYILEYPGYGLRTGTASRKSINAAATEAYLELRRRYPSLPVCVAGESIGSGAASFLATLPKAPDKIVLVVPFDKLSMVAREHAPAWLVRIVLRDNWDNIAALAGYRGPVDIFGAQMDTVIPVKHAQALAASIPQARFTLLAGGHNDWSRGDQVRIRNE